MVFYAVTAVIVSVTTMIYGLVISYSQYDDKSNSFTYEDNTILLSGVVLSLLCGLMAGFFWPFTLLVLIVFSIMKFLSLRKNKHG